MRFDHLVLVVKDLDSATRHFNELGFTVKPGGVHPDWGTHNALIGLGDGSYLELLAPTLPGKPDSSTPIKSLFHRRFMDHLAAGEGIADFALLSDDLERDLQTIRTRGLGLSGPFEGSRLREDGVQIEWKSAATESADLPFLIEDLTPRERRVPTGPDCSHANSVLGIGALSIACRDLDQSAGQYQQLLGINPDKGEARRPGNPATARFRIEETVLNLFPVDDNMAIRSRAAAPLSIALRTSPGSIPLILRFSQEMGYCVD